MRNWIIGVLTLIVAINAILGLIYQPVWWFLILTFFVWCVAIYDANQKHHSILRNFPLIGRVRWTVEALRPYLQQYVLETDTGGAPISRMFRTIVYQRAKNNRETVPFGTQLDTYENGYEWIGHSLSARELKEMDDDPRVNIGGPDCKKPYSASVLNISAMSFGSLSKNAILALNKGAAKGGFFHNTGEGGLTPYHLENGGDVVWQIGTGYFGCRTKDGRFDEKTFEEKAQLEQVKMIEIKLSQGAKPGHGGILPAYKNTPEIADIRGVEPGTQVDSPPRHSAFSTPIEMVDFIAKLRKLSGGKPVGIKLALGRKSEFVAMCKAMVKTGVTPDFITVDGGEGGTGAAPLEYTNSIGFPLREALAFVDDCLIGFDLRHKIKIIASGKIITAFQLAKNLSLGADLCNSARGMMLALGCVQSLSCNTNRCPTGVATQDPKLTKGLDVADKSIRVYLFHKKTLHALMDILSSTGHVSTTELNRTHIFRRVNQCNIARYDEIFPLVKRGSLLQDEVPERFKLHVKEANADSFMPCSLLADIEEETKEVS
ncbi:FMN-binding glutamate synthase family protein [Alteromonas australica]|mgnify:FL=1|uniref:FMN-binding glutamate synthase family protein n=1 Tax=Alteromonas australica TaxID=589873 RepID=UPI000C46D88B|nr:FMN-binding glutamate synthase family protein [Alteromonas australica]MBU34983.1 FMN-binding glutamate synthase family protein [Alteromonas sp.]|tara:strand:- start:4205 stop:5836 length:1632 start_codon:yes stop_codon:yes gene_type:complete